MRNSQDRILVTHAGRLSSGMAEVAAMDARLNSGAGPGAAEMAQVLDRAVEEIVAQQLEAGVDVVSDGELSRGRGFGYYKDRIEGIELRDLKPGEVGVTIFRSRDRDTFKQYYAAADASRPTVARPHRIVCTGPLRHKSLEVLEREIARFKAATAGGDVEGFFPVIAPGWLDHFIFNDHYESDEAFVFALAEMMRPEYQAVVDAGLILQVDDPGLPDAWPTFIPKPTLESYRRYARVRIEALNHALRDIPEDRVRYHCCWGSWNGPHVEDIPLADIVDLMLLVKAQGYSIEAANPRHEHEWKIWRDVALPDGKILIPGAVTHRTDTVEHPEVIADRLLNFARLVGRENVQAGTDCGMGLGRVHHEVGWAKLRALAEGARLASRELW